MSEPSFLSRIHKPHDVADLSPEDLAFLAEELRERIISVVSRNGGHLAPSLGVVELTLALCSVFDPDRDKVVWDVGHQSYAWKLLTGRNDRFDTLRRFGGLSGFPKICESPYDHFGTGHSSTSLSAALGLAMARDLHNEKHHVLAVIGDGSLTGGQAFEGLNLAGDMQRRLIVVLNDNEMSIAPNVGALSLFLSRTLSRSWVRQTKKDVLRLLRSIPRIGTNLVDIARRSEMSFKGFFTPGMLFEAFRFTYIGPIQGHDTKELIRHLQMAAEVEDRPVLLHVLTRKGKGYPPAENNPSHFHGVGGFEPETGNAPAKKAAPPSFTDIFGATLCDLAENDPRIVAITAAMPEGTGTLRFQERFPERFVDVGICEQHAVTFAAGLAKEGLRPVVAIYSTFLQRAYDQVVHDVCIQNLPVVLCADRAGLVGEDGPTHHGVFDLAYLRHIPNISILAPRDEALMRRALCTAVGLPGPSALRYPRGAGFGVAADGPLVPLPAGRGELLAEGEDALVIALGSRVHPALEAARLLREEDRRVAVFDPIWVKPLPRGELLDFARRYDRILLVEEGSRAGGFSSAVLELWSDEGVLRGQKIRRLGIPDSFVEHGTQCELRALVGLRAAGIAAALRELLI